MRVAITVPCFNEERRLQGREFLRLLDDERIELAFVDDGSTDATASRLDELCDQAGGRASVVRLSRNSGKSEAVRTGMRRSLDAGAGVVGFADADLATPVDELRRLVDVLCETGAGAVIGSRRIGRGAEPGAAIERRFARRVLGRAFSLLGSAALRRRLHDTQCGAKMFRRSPAIVEALAHPFRSRWAFDVELLGRYLVAAAGDDALVEVPLRRWSEVPGSKFGALHMVRAGLDLAAVAVELERLRRHR